MGELDIGQAEVGAMKSNVSDYSVDTYSIDGPTGQKEFSYSNTKFTQYMGYYKNISELGSAIDTKAFWAVGKGYTADKKTEAVLKKIKGWGKDTFNTIIENMVRTYQIGGDAFSEIVKDKKGRLINLKPLNPAEIKIITDERGMLLRYEQSTGFGKSVIRFEPKEIFHLAWNRIANEIHGTSTIEKVEDIILMRNEAMTDMKTVFHRYVKPLWVWALDTDDETKISAFKAKADKTVANSENIYIPKGAAEAERVSVPQYSTLDPLPWIENLTQYFFQATNIPDVILGSAKETTEASAKILYLAFQQTIEKNQLFIEENLKSQLNIEVDYEFPASIENDLIKDNKKDGAVNIDKNETTATIKENK